jgi:hypothetical protein
MNAAPKGRRVAHAAGRSGWNTRVIGDLRRRWRRADLRQRVLLVRCLRDRG